ncbi:hypothetical protein [Paradevosia shaoguanensis]|uniref:Uncharacterized protein n=1 Tax=Paradevosia shaoguanensis TaxID=1335043 RepID=A0AA41QT07_9HYPH|nr:hypothetical protein [Paradevosia shaoguanensis]MCF1744628.1 hypothetical protein [Paradevosia shaoguanensis]MCI0129111.1 hypothetical protein [Paradevosia shaoguanensis]
MTALTQGRNTPRVSGDIKRLGVATGVTIFEGAIVMRTATGFGTKGQTALNLVGVGMAMNRAIGGASDGAEPIDVRVGIFRFANSAAADAITIADIGKPAYAVDDQTVAKTNGTNTRSIAGFIYDVDDLGVLVAFDEAAVRSFIAGTAA